MCTMANPGNLLRYNTLQSAPPVSALAHSRAQRCPSHQYLKLFLHSSSIHGAEEEHGKECPWQLGAVSESVECEMV